MSDRQQHVLNNIQRVTHDGARVERRYQLDGENVSRQVRGLLDKSLVVIGDAGALVKTIPIQPRKRQANEGALRDIRAALEAAPSSVRRYPGAQRRRRVHG